MMHKLISWHSASRVVVIFINEIIVHRGQSRKCGMNLTTFSSDMQIRRLKRIRNCVGLPLPKRGEIRIALISADGRRSTNACTELPHQQDLPCSSQGREPVFYILLCMCRLTASIEMNGILCVYLSVACAPQHMWNSGLRRVSLRAVVFPYLSAIRCLSPPPTHFHLLQRGMCGVRD